MTEAPPDGNESPSEETQLNKSGPTPAAAFPTALLKTRAEPVWRVLRASRMWWITLLCLLVAVILTGNSIEPTGPEIVIQFPEGHGLRAGDSVRHRGIDVGYVTAIELNPELSGVGVTVTLNPAADVLAREGTRFWIMRPQVSLLGVSGLETAVGAKYIATSPGDSDGEVCNEFEGLANIPVDETDADGIEIILRGDESHGLSPGSPVTWRGVEVGRILSVGLSGDTRFVDIRTRVDAAYRRLVRPNSRFWVISPVDVDAGLLSGVKLHVESLTTIARGGVAFMTPDAGEPTEPVAAGHVFRLHEKSESKWATAASTGLIDFPLPPTVVVEATWRQKQFGITRSRHRTSHALLIGRSAGATGNWLTGPADTLTKPATAIDDSWELEIRLPGVSGALASVSEASAPEATASEAKIVGMPITVRGSRTAVTARGLRVPVEPEDCCLVRSVHGAGGPSSVVESISVTQLVAGENFWTIKGLDDRHPDDWHGAAVVAMNDQKIIGLFVISREGPAVALLTDAVVP